MRSDQIPASVLSGGRRLTLPDNEPFDIVGPVDLNYLKVRITSVNQNCVNCRGGSGIIRQLDLASGVADGVKVHSNGAKDLILGTLGTPSTFAPLPTSGTVHIDGWQVMSGSNIKFLSWVVQLPYNMGNAACFINRGSDAMPIPTGILVEKCHFGDGGSKPVQVATSKDVTLKDCVGWKSKMWNMGLSTNANAQNFQRINWVEHPAGSFVFANSVAAVDDGDSTVPPDPPPTPPTGDCQAQLAACQAALNQERAMSATLNTKVSQLRDGIDDADVMISALSQQ